MLLTTPIDCPYHPCYTLCMNSNSRPAKQPTDTTPRRIGRMFSWFVPGIGIKRWLVMILAGITLLGLGLGMVILDLYRTNTRNSLVLLLLGYASLRFLPRLIRVLIFGGLG